MPGIMASSPLWYSHIKNMITMTPPPTKRPMMVGEFQAFWVPPQVNARSIMKIPGMKMAPPVRSKLLILSPTLRLRLSGGGLKKKNMVASVTAPGGKLIQKHHRQVAFSEKTPDKMGPRMTPSAKQLLQMPMNKGFVLGEAMSRTMVIPPVARPEAPMPATARPTMKALLVWAQPHTMLPTRKIEQKVM